MDSIGATKNKILYGYAHAHSHLIGMRVVASSNKKNIDPIGNFMAG